MKTIINIFILSSLLSSASAHETSQDFVFGQTAVQPYLGLELGDHWSQKQEQVESLQPRQSCGDRIVCGGARGGIRQQLLAADNGSVDSFHCR